MGEQDRPTVVDVADRAGVSTAAVSYALNGKPGVSEATRERVLDAADELGFVPNRAARALVRRRAAVAALVLRRSPDTLALDPFWPPLLAGLGTVCSRSGWSLQLRLLDADDDDAERAVYTELAMGGSAGFVLADLRPDDPRPGWLRELGVASVALGRPEQAPGTPSVGVDDRPGIRACVEHLLQLGHTRIAHVAGTPGLVHSASRLASFRSTLEGAGLRPGPVVDGDFTAAGGAAATKRLLALSGPPPTAVVFANDLMATAGAAVLTERGLSVPADVSVTGYDDAPLSAHLSPPLTTVALDPVAWGERAAAVLLAAVDGAPLPPGELDPARLVVRGSTAAPPARR